LQFALPEQQIKIVWNRDETAGKNPPTPFADVYASNSSKIKSFRESFT
jgi:hypothetical protein